MKDFKNREEIFAYLEVDGARLKNLDYKLRNDKEIVIKAISTYMWALKYASKNIQSNKEAVLEATNQYGWSLRFASKELKSDKDFIFEILKINGFA